MDTNSNTWTLKKKNEDMGQRDRSVAGAQETWVWFPALHDSLSLPWTPPGVILEIKAWSNLWPIREIESKQTIGGNLKFYCLNSLIILLYWVHKYYNYTFEILLFVHILRHLLIKQGAI